MEKLLCKGTHEQIMHLIRHWLDPRRARVVVEGQFSDGYSLFNMVFQGTVWGPPLWNCFFEDARLALNAKGYSEIAYADDLNASRYFPRATPNSEIEQSQHEAQAILHEWGDANQVHFDATKEHFRIMDTQSPTNLEFRLLGIEFDEKLQMGSAVHECVNEAGWRMTRILRTRRFFTDRDLIIHYKSHVLSYMEYRTPGIYHAATTVLQPLDNVQTRFLSDLGVPEIVALFEFNLAPLHSRRDIAILGVIHRTLLGEGAPHFRQFFYSIGRGMYSLRRRHDRHIFDWMDGHHLDILDRSALGLCRIYNLLPQRIVHITNVKDFQTALQDLLKATARAGCENWQHLYSPRLSLANHPLLYA